MGGGGQWEEWDPDDYEHSTVRECGNDECERDVIS